MGAVVVQLACREQGARLDVRGEGTHIKHVAYVCDAGRVEAQQLVERHRSLPSCKEGTRNGARCGPGGERAVGAVVVQATCREGLDRLDVRGDSTHREHVAHVCDG